MINEIKEAMKKVHKHGWSNFNDVSCEEDKFVAEYDNLRECQGGLIAISETVDDATFIANTPTYIRYLLDELEKAQKENAAMKHALERYGYDDPEFPVMYDGGEHARIVLATLTKEESHE